MSYERRHPKQNVPSESGHFVYKMQLWYILTQLNTKKSTCIYKCRELIKDEALLTVSCPIFPSILIAKNLLTGSLKNTSIDNLETQKKSISMKNSQFFNYLLYAKSK